MTICLTKIPVFDYAMTQIAYLLPWVVTSQPEDDHSKHLVKLLKEVELEHLLGHAQGYIQIPANSLNSHHLSQLPEHQLVLCIESALLKDDKLFEEVERLKAQNFQIALTHVKTVEDIEPFVKMATCILLDASVLSEDEMKAIQKSLESHSLPILLTNINDIELFESSKATFNAFSGDFYLRPNVKVKTAKAPANRMVLVKLMSELHQEDVDAKTISDLVGQDARLGYQMLKIINSSMYNLPREIESLHEAVVLLGVKQIRDWANMILISNLKDKPNAVLKTTMFRAKMSELLAEVYAPEKAETYFTIGLFSTIDAMLNKDMEEAINQLPFAAEIKKVLISREGDYAPILNAMLEFEKGNFEHFEKSKLDIEQVMKCYLDANLWTYYTSKLLFGA